MSPIEVLTPKRNNDCAFILKANVFPSCFVAHDTALTIYYVCHSWMTLPYIVHTHTCITHMYNKHNNKYRKTNLKISKKHTNKQVKFFSPQTFTTGGMYDFMGNHSKATFGLVLGNKQQSDSTWENHSS